ncbi:MAG: AMIN domain-containing protein, partial [Gammaproteobacteria bacterium]|nr:AMIN domain-containing protein [Gammaproteobacteria bacterium]
ISTAFSPDGSRVLTGSFDRTAKLWDGFSGELLVSLAHEQAVISVAFSPDGSRVLTGSEDTTAKLWDADVQLSTPFAHQGQISAVAFSADGRRVATGASDQTARLWDANSGDELHSLVHGGRESSSFDGNVTSLAFSLDSSQLLTGEYTGTASLWNVETGENTASFLLGSGIRSVALSPDGSKALSGLANGSVLLWNTDNGETVSSMSHASTVWSVAFNSSGNTIATGSEGASARLWAENGDLLHSLAHDYAVYSVAFSPDDSQLLTGSFDGRIRLWDVESGTELMNLHHGGAVYSVAFSPDGSRLLSSSDNRSSRLWDASSGENLATLEHEAAARAAAFGPDGRIIIGSNDGKAVIWTIANSDVSGRFSMDVAAGSTPSFLSAQHTDRGNTQQRRLTPSAEAIDVDVQLGRSTQPWAEWIFENMTLLSALIASIPVLYFVLWWSRSRSVRNVVVNRRTSDHQQEESGIALAPAEHGLYQGDSYTRARLAALRRNRSGKGELEINATVEETTRRLGWFSPRYRVRSYVPEYLILVDRQSFDDQQSRLNDEFINRLKKDGLHIERYYFDHDPRLCKSDRAYARAMKLRELAARFHQHRLIIFSDGTGFMDPLSGRMAQWSEILKSWPDRALMTAAPVSTWSALELELADGGLMVVPATPVGLQIFVESIASVKKTEISPKQRMRALPEIITTHADRWLQREEPESEEISDLIRDVRWYLGEDGFRWLTALAVYPELNWHITLHLGVELKDKSGEAILDEKLLLSLTRLPWLRKAYMPDWLRVELLHNMAEADESVVREFLFDLTLDKVDPHGSGFYLNIARDSADHKKPMFKNVVRQFFNTEPSESELRDYVFVEFLLGRPAKKLEMVVPPRWKRWVFNQGSDLLGVRTAPGVLVMLTFVFVVWEAGAFINYQHELSIQGSNTMVFSPQFRAAENLTTADASENDSEVVTDSAIVDNEVVTNPAPTDTDVVANPRLVDINIVPDFPILGADILPTLIGPFQISDIVAAGASVGEIAVLPGFENLWNTVSSNQEVFRGIEVSRNFMMSRQLGGSTPGRLLVSGHEGLNYDNEQFVVSMIDWLRAGRAAVVGITTSHSETITVFPGSDNLLLMDSMIASIESLGIEVRRIDSPISAESLADVSVLIMGNAWGEISANESAAVDEFLLGGGGMLASGIGWSYQLYGPDAFDAINADPLDINDYPMNQLMRRYGIQWTEATLTVEIGASVSTGDTEGTAPTNAESYRLNVLTQPPNALVWLVEQNREYVSGLSLPPGRYALTTSAPNYTTRLDTVRISDADASVQLELTPLPSDDGQGLTLTDIRFANLLDDIILIQLGFNGSPPEFVTFTLDNPARISIDFPGTASGLSQQRFNIEASNTQSVLVLDDGNRSRVVVNLDQLVSYETRLQGNAVFLRILNEVVASEDAGVSSTDSAQAIPVIDQENLLDGTLGGQGIGRFSDQNGVADPSANRYDFQDAQSFTVAIDGQLAEIHVPLRNLNGATEDIEMEIVGLFADGLPNDLDSFGVVSVTAAEAVDVDLDDPETWVKFDFRGFSIDVEAGQQLAYQLRTIGTVYINYTPESTNGYQAGSGYRRNLALESTWNAMAADFGFRTLVIPLGR